jgi:predicted PurR-regulated permease PerM
MIRLILKLNNFFWKISRKIDRRKAWIFHTVLWTATIFIVSYIFINLLIIWVIFSIILLLSFLLNLLYEYIKSKWNNNIALTILIIWVCWIASMLSFVTYNYPKINNLVINTSKTISESIPLSKRWLIKDLWNLSTWNQNITKEVKVWTWWIE